MANATLDQTPPIAADAPAPAAIVDEATAPAEIPDDPQWTMNRKFSARTVHWKVVIGIAAMHVGALLAFMPQLFSWSGLAICLVLFWVTGGLGITLGFHRLLTHRSFKTPKVVEYFLSLCGALAWQGGPITWVGTHRLHHRDSDQPEDPHSPVHGGFWWSHMVWCMVRNHCVQDPKSVAKDLLRDPVLVLMDRLFFLPQFVLMAVLLGVGTWIGGIQLGLSWVVWGVFLRVVLVYHNTWFVNSATHVWGYRNFETTDHSTNLWWVAILAFGEGWHNNHHAHPRSAAHGMRWFEFDLTYNTIRVMKWFGLARDIVLDQKALAQAGMAGKPGSPDTQPRSRGAAA